MRHPEAERPAGLEHVPGPHVVTGHDADGLGEPAKPRFQLVLKGRPAGGLVAGEKHIYGFARCVQPAGKRLASRIGPDRDLGRRETIEPEVRDGPLEQVLGRELRDLIVVGVDIRNAARGVERTAATAYGHDRQRRGPDQPRDPFGVERRDDSLARPGVEVGEPAVLFLLDIEPPVADLASVLGHALRDLTIIRDRRIDHDRHKRLVTRVRSSLCPHSTFRSRHRRIVASMQDGDHAVSP